MPFVPQQHTSQAMRAWRMTVHSYTPPGGKPTRHIGSLSEDASFASILTPYPSSELTSSLRHFVGHWPVLLEELPTLPSMWPEASAEAVTVTLVLFASRPSACSTVKPCDPVGSQQQRIPSGVVA